MIEQRMMVVSTDGQFCSDVEIPIADFKAWLDGELAKIPTQYSHSAFIYVGASQDYGYLEVRFRQPETEEARVARESMERDIAEGQERYDSFVYERLKTKDRKDWYPWEHELWDRMQQKQEDK